MTLIVYTEVTSPVAVYDAEGWMAVGGMSVNISLIEQTLGDFDHAYWLRVGVMFDEDVRQSDIVKQDDTHTPVVVENDGAGAPVIVETIVDGLSSPTIPPLTPNQHPAVTSREPEEEDPQLYTIAVLSSEVGKLMVPRADDWVDLCAVGGELLWALFKTNLTKRYLLHQVDPTEYYMVK